MRLFASPADNASRIWVTELMDSVVALFLTQRSVELKMSSAGNRQRSHHAGHYERRTHCASTRHQSPSRWPLCQADLLQSGPRRDLVPQVVAPLPGGRPRGPLRPDASQPPCHPTHPARTRAGHPLHPPSAPGPRLASHPLLSDRGHGHPRRAEGPGDSSAPLHTHHRACLATPME